MADKHPAGAELVASGSMRQADRPRSVDAADQITDGGHRTKDAAMRTFGPTRGARNEKTLR